MKIHQSAAARSFPFKTVVVSLFVSSLVSISPLSSAEKASRQIRMPNPKLFPVPKVIEPNVEFWKLIYAVYPSNRVLIHDSENLDVIYEVADCKLPNYRWDNVAVQ